MESREGEKAPDGDRREAGRPRTKRLPVKKWLIIAGGAVLAVAVLAAGYVYAVSPGPIRSPQMDHYHFRMQIVVGGQDVNFAKQPFQTPYVSGQCSADLPSEPIHFHDLKGQFTHIHWAGMTGGLVLKNYGWNFVGGAGDTLGYRMDNLPRVTRVPIHGKVLPDVSQDATFWVYTGDENGYKKRSFEEFKDQDLEQFFGKESNFPKAASRSLTDVLFPRAYAHGDEVHDESAGVDGERLERLNNLIGNVVIFVQQDEPSDAQIKAKFAHLEPLSETTCAG